MTNVLTPNDVPRDSEERRAWALIHLRRRGLPAADLAARAGVSTPTVHKVFTGASERMEMLVAEALGLKPQELFPERYTAEGKRTRITRPRGQWKEQRKAYAHG